MTWLCQLFWDTMSIIHSKLMMDHKGSFLSAVRSLFLYFELLQCNEEAFSRQVFEDFFLEHLYVTNINKPYFDISRVISLVERRLHMHACAWLISAHFVSQTKYIYNYS